LGVDFDALVGNFSIKLIGITPAPPLKLLISGALILVCGVPIACGKEVRLVRTLVAGLIIAIVCLVTYAVTSIQNSW